VVVLFLLLLSTTISLLSAFINGFPIVFSDTSTYLASGFSLETPVDRPIIYGILLRLFSLNGLSLWLVIGISTFLLCWLLFKVIITFFGMDKEKSALATVVICLILSLFSSFSWNNSQLMPDIFTPILLLTTILLLKKRTFNRRDIGLYFLFVVATSTHLSHITYNVAFLVTIGFLGYLIPKMRNFINFKVLFALIGLTFLSILTMGSALSKSRHVFFMGAMVEHGLAKAYIDENCANHNFGLCAYKDDLPKLAWRFVWDEDSPLYTDAVGGWKGSKEEFNKIINATLTERKYIGMHITASIRATLDQLQRSAIGDGNGVFLDGTLLFSRIQKYFPHEALAYKNSLQQKGKLEIMTKWNSLYNWVAIIALFIIVILSVITAIKYGLRTSHYLVIAVLISVFLHSWVCATFANASERFGAKMFWLILFGLSIQLIDISLYHTKKQKKGNLKIPRFL
jgi:hypothetical protein